MNNWEYDLFLIEKTQQKYINTSVSWQHSGNMVAPGNMFVAPEEHIWDKHYAEEFHTEIINY